ncbi:hypothetical protein F5Y13DRAFT_185579 [Hypoxylon sp. FL1857]|nr:hypothetical protein F5Y13DRAFT_185579 [Hypoxylon sp. FL1857]
MDPQPSLVEAPKSPLLRIPIEVIIHIASYLTTPEYGMFRLVCRHTEHNLFNSFVQEFFAKREFMLTEFSLQTLLDISKSRLRIYLKYLIINLERPTLRQYPHVIVQIHQGTANSIQAIQHNRLQEEYLSHQGLIASGQDLELLTQALRNLPTLHTISLRDFFRCGRYRDGGDCCWHAYGAPTLVRETGIGYIQPSFRTQYRHEGMDGDFKTYARRTFWTILRAMGKAKEMSSLPQLEVILRNSWLPDDAFSIPRYFEPTILPVLQNLKVLFLDLGHNSFPTIISTEGRQKNHSFLHLAAFLSKALSLEHLRLNFRNCPGSEARDILQWFADVPTPSEYLPLALGNQSNVPGNLPELPHTPQFPHLVQLDIGMVEIELPLLLAIYMRYRESLRKISLHRVTLHSPPKSPPRPPNSWREFLHHITRLDFNLSTLRLSSLKERCKNSHSTLEFKFPGQREGEDRSTREWNGRDWNYASREFIQSMVTIGPGQQWLYAPDSDSDDEV